VLSSAWSRRLNVVMRHRAVVGICVGCLLGCGKTASDEPPAPSADPHDGLARFELTLIEELEHGFGLGAETLMLRAEGPWLMSDWAGADGAYVEGTFLYGLVKDNVLEWHDFFEQSGSLLHDMGSASGLALSRDARCRSCFFITDAADAAVKNYLNGEVYQGKLAIDGADLQGIAVAGSGSIFVADAEKRRIFRVSADLGAVEAVATLPDEVGGQVPTGLAFDDQDRLHVCFRDSERIAMFMVGD